MTTTTVSTSKVTPGRILLGVIALAAILIYAVFVQSYVGLRPGWFPLVMAVLLLVGGFMTRSKDHSLCWDPWYFIAAGGFAVFWALKYAFA